jgi:hypothetical protein
MVEEEKCLEVVVGAGVVVVDEDLLKRRRMQRNVSEQLALIAEQLEQ